MKHWDNINLVSLVLWPVSMLFRLLAGSRRLLFKTGLLKAWRAPVPVIVVGNISVGGTGKTPVVIALVQWLKSEGYKPGVISRGYGARKTSQPTILQADSAPADVGDEPVLIARRTAVPVCVFPKRVMSAQHLLRQNDCDVLVADDGLQHYALQRDLEIIVIDALKLHGNNFCLPAGPLREPVSRIDHRAFTLYNRMQATDDGKSFALVPGNFIALDGSREQSADSFGDSEVLACAGTASPERFFATLRTLGLDIESRVFPDHHRFVADDFANNKRAIIMTEKDAVKCQDFGLENAWYLPVDTQLPEPLLKRVLQVLGTPQAKPNNKQQTTNIETMTFKHFKIVIPARYASSRFPGKPLALLSAKPMIWHVWQRALETGCDEIVVATDDERIRDVVIGFGCDVMMTDENCASGTDRIAEVAAKRGWSDDTIIVNLQGDEPLTPPSIIAQVAYNLSQHKQAGIATLCSTIKNREDFHNPNIVKVLFDAIGMALYFSRAPIPWPRDNEDGNPINAFRHIGLYAYRAEFLKHWQTMSDSTLENTEKLEQLRAMQAGVRIHVEEACSAPPHGVDTPEQLLELEQLLSGK